VDAHTPGSIALLHRPSRHLFAGGLLSPSPAWLRGGPPQLTVPPPAYSSSPEKVGPAARRLLLEVRAQCIRAVVRRC
jgi:glyoxylase-like metal-dependent hydrolase (beta-lactamase superfamily II)